MNTVMSRASGVLETNRTLRNTFMLLSITLIPTIIGVWFGMTSGLNAWMTLHPIMGVLSFIGVMMLLMFCVAMTKESFFGVFFLLVFTFVMGSMLSTAIENVLKVPNGSLIVAQAAIGTIVVTFTCGLYAMVTKRDFSSIGGALFGMLIGIIVVSMLNMWLQLPFLNLVISCVALCVFSLYLIFDIQSGVNGGETNYIMLTMNIYLDIINIFINLLSILSNTDD